MPGLKVAPQLTLPAEFVTQPNAILAMRGAGKSNAAVRMAEQLHANGLPFVVIDPKGDWWGIRSSRDGRGPGLPIPVFGGLHGDVPLEAGAGALLAETVVELNLTCVLDVSEFASKNEQIRFLTDFGDRLFRLHGKHPHPRHLFLEEADEFIPQTSGGGKGPIGACIGAWTKIVKQGRSRGLGITIITQRSAVVAKDALTQVETLFAMRSTSPQDRKAIEGWVEYHSVSKELVDSLPTLAAGEAWVISPHWLKRFERIAFYQRETFDSGATPEHGKLRQPANLADIDLDKLRSKMEAAIEKAENENPKRLQARVKELVGIRDRLQRELETAKAGGTVVEEVKVEVEIEVPFVPPEIAKEVSAAYADLARLQTEAEKIEDRLRQIEVIINREPPRKLRAPKPVPPSPAPAVTRPAPTTRTAAPPREVPDGEVRLDQAARRVLTVLAQYPQGRSMKQIAALSGYSLGASTIGNALAKLRKAGFCNRAGEPVKITEEGAAYLGDDYERLPTGEELVAYWRDKTDGRGKRVLDAAARAMYEVLLDIWPEEATLELLSERTGYSAEASTIGNAMAKLRKLELVEGWKMSPEFMEAVRG